jgi:hypothetical protein
VTVAAGAPPTAKVIADMIAYVRRYATRIRSSFILPRVKWA